MPDKEKIALLTFIRDNQNISGVSRSEIVAFMYRSGINLDIGSALIDTCKDENLINKPWHSDTYTLTSTGVIWLRDEKFNQDRLNYTTLAHKIANQEHKPIISQSSTDWSKRSTYATYITGFLAIVVAICIAKCSINKSEENQNSTKQHSNNK